MHFSRPYEPCGSDQPGARSREYDIIAFGQMSHHRRGSSEMHHGPAQYIKDVERTARQSAKN